MFIHTSRIFQGLVVYVFKNVCVFMLVQVDLHMYLTFQEFVVYVSKYVCEFMCVHVYMRIYVFTRSDQSYIYE